MVEVARLQYIHIFSRPRKNLNLFERKPSCRSLITHGLSKVNLLTYFKSSYIHVLTDAKS